MEYFVHEIDSNFIHPDVVELQRLRSMPSVRAGRSSSPAVARYAETPHGLDMTCPFQRQVLLGGGGQGLSYNPAPFAR